MHRARIVCALIGVLLGTLPAAAPGADAADDARAVAAQLAALARTYKLEIVTSGERFPVQSTHGIIGGADASEEQVAAYRPLLLEALARYPVAFLRQTGLRRFVLCKDLSFAGQARYAVPDFPHDTMYLHVERPASFQVDPSGSFVRYLQKVFHHELFHLIDWKDDGLLYEDRGWAALNPATFRYGTGGKDMRDDPTVSLISHDVSGFLNAYSTAGVEEDKAEVFANLMVNSAELTERVRTDEIIARKVAALVTRLDVWSEAAAELFAGVIPLRSGALTLAPLRVLQEGREVSSPTLDAARKAGRPILLYVGRRAWRPDKKAAAVQARASTRFETDVLSSPRVADACQGWTLLYLEAGASDAAKFARKLGAKQAPAVFLWRPEVAHPVRLGGKLEASALVRALAAGEEPK